MVEWRVKAKKKKGMGGSKIFYGPREFFLAVSPPLHHL